MHSGPITCIALSHDGKKLYTGGYDKNIFVWDRTTGKSRLLGTHRHLVNSLTLSADGTVLASASSDYTVKLYDLATEKLITTLYGHNDDVEAVAFADHDRVLITASRDVRCMVWDVKTGRILTEFRGHTQDPNAAWVYKDRVFTTGDDGRCMIWTYADGQLLREVGPFEHDLDAVGGNERTGLFAVGGDDGRVMIFDAETLELCTTLQAHQRGVKRVSFSPSGTYLLTAGYDHSLRVWHVETGELYRELPPTVWQWERAIAWSPDELSVFSGSFGGSCCEWRLEDGCLLTEVKELATPSINDLAVGLDLIVTASDDGRYRINGESVNAEGGVLTNGAALSADGTLAIWGDHAGAVHVADVYEKRVIASLQTGSGPVNTIKYGAADHSFYVGTYGGHVHRLCLERLEWTAELRAHQGAVKALEVTDERLVTCSSDGSVHVYSRSTLEQEFSLAGSILIVNDLCVHEPSHSLAAVGRDKIVRLYDLSTRMLKAHHNVHNYSVKSVAVTEDGVVFSGDYWGYVAIWNPTGGDRPQLIRVGTNGISAVRALGDVVYASSYDGAVYRIDAQGQVEEAIRLFDQSSQPVAAL